MLLHSFVSRLRFCVTKFSRDFVRWFSHGFAPRPHTLPLWLATCGGSSVTLPSCSRGLCWSRPPMLEERCFCCWYNLLPDRCQRGLDWTSEQAFLALRVAGGPAFPWPILVAPSYAGGALFCCWYNLLLGRCQSGLPWPSELSSWHSLSECQEDPFSLSESGSELSSWYS